MRGIVDSLNKCEIQSWSEATLIIMMSLFGHHSTEIIFVDPENVARLKRETQELFFYNYSRKITDLNISIQNFKCFILLYGHF